MNEHIEACIEQLTERRDRIDAAIETLRGLDGSTELGGSNRANAPAPKREIKRRMKMGEKINGSGKRRQSSGLRGSVLAAALPAIRGLKEPFKTEDVERACRVDKKKASNFVTQLKGKGWIELAGETNGHFKRTATFGGIQLADIHAEIAAGRKSE